MRKEIDANVLARVARMYYIHGMTQAEIAKEFKTSRSMVSIMLQRAKERGIVSISYNIINPQSNLDEYSEQIEKYCNLQKCFVVPLNRKDEMLAIRFISERAEIEVNDYLKRDSIIGISSGYTCTEFMKAYHQRHDIKNVEVVPLVGGSNRTKYDIQINEMVRHFAEKIHGSPHYVYAPENALSSVEKDLYMQSSQMKTILEKWDTLDLAVIGIGSIPETEKQNEWNITKKLIEETHANPDMSVCNICGRAINMMGEEITSLNEHLITIPLEELKKTKKVIAIATGPAKALSIIAALRSGVINTLIVDEQTGKSVIEHFEYLKKKNYIDGLETERTEKPDVKGTKVKELMDEYGVKKLDDIQEFINTVASKAINEALNSRIITDSETEEPQ